jgi:two-component system, OmpR family, phosphate regulon sensor histidine kinase PhoR
MTKYRTRLLVALITLIFTVLIGLGLLIGQLFKNYYSNSFNDHLKKETSLVTSYIEENGGLGTLNQKKLDQISKVLESRISLSDTTGRLVFDSGEINTSVQNNRHQEIIQEMVRDYNPKKDRLEIGGEYDMQYYWKPLLRGKEVEGYVFVSTKMGVLNQAYGQIWWLLTISLVLALLVIIVLGMKITSRYTKPVESATKVAIELAKGNYRARTYEEHMDETGMLSASINILARNLQDMRKSQEMQQERLTTLIENMGSGLILIDNRGYISMINRAFKNIFQVQPADFLLQPYYDVFEHREISDLIEEIFMTEQKLKRQMVIPLGIEMHHFEVDGAPIISANNVWKGILLVFHDITELKKLEQMRKDFVANVSHELKTPITSIKGFTETLLDGAKEDPDSLGAFLHIIAKESERLQTLIQDLLDLSKTEQQGFKLNIERINLTAILDEVMTILEKKAGEKGISIEFERTDNHIFINGDQYRLKQVFINLINNAIMYTTNDGGVTVTVEERGEKVLIHVKDTGIGIEKQEIPRIFERFYRIDRARSRNSGGTGLGLAIVKHLIEAHRGTIAVTSDLGKGSVFTISLKKNLKK